VGTILTNQPNDHRDSSDLASPPLPGHVAAPVRRAHGISRIGYAVGALVVIAGASAILFTGALSPSAPATPVKVEPANTAALPQGLGIDQGASPDMAAVNLETANTAALPPMSNSMGMWDHVSYPKSALSAMENDTRYWDPNWVPLQPSASEVTAPSNDLAYWDEGHPPYPALPAMTRDLGYGDRIQPPTSTVQCATKYSCRESHTDTIQAPTQSVAAAPPNSFGSFDFSTYHPTAGIPAQSPDSASTLQCPTVLVTCRSSNGAQVPASSSTLPPMSNDMGYWDRIQPPTQPDPELSTSVGYRDFTTYPTFAP
jgi:hypothetical protein